ncbi:MAG: tRNA (5-methylaminomethyl-2-thiouridine)(34)-methyltransferase MnmD [Bacteroidales bacterium]
MNNLKLVKTVDGSHTLYNPDLDEHYHSVNGAIIESEIVFIKNGLRFSGFNPVNIFEVGFGTGLNALLTLGETAKIDRKINYTAIEKYPLTADLAGKLNYAEFCGDEIAGHFMELHEARWNTPVKITERFTLTKIEGDMHDTAINYKFDLIYFDAFAPSKQPDMWTEEIIEKIASMTVSGGIFVTYSSRGELKRSLKRNGFSVELLKGPPGKREVTRGIKF